MMVLKGHLRHVVFPHVAKYIPICCRTVAAAHFIEFLTWLRKNQISYSVSKIAIMIYIIIIY